MTSIEKMLADNPQLQAHFADRAADPSVSGNVLLAELQAAGLPAKRTAVFRWRQKYRVAKRHRPNSLAGRVASALRNADAGQLAGLGLPPGNPTLAVFKLGRKRLYAVARHLGLYPADASPSGARLKRA